MPAMRYAYQQYDADTPRYFTPMIVSFLAPIFSPAISPATMIGAAKSCKRRASLLESVSSMSRPAQPGGGRRGDDSRRDYRRPQRRDDDNERAIPMISCSILYFSGHRTLLDAGGSGDAYIINVYTRKMPICFSDEFRRHCSPMGRGRYFQERTFLAPVI